MRLHSKRNIRVVRVACVVSLVLVGCASEPSVSVQDSAYGCIIQDNCVRFLTFEEAGTIVSLLEAAKTVSPEKDLMWVPWVRDLYLPAVCDAEDRPERVWTLSDHRYVRTDSRFSKGKVFKLTKNDDEKMTLLCDPFRNDLKLMDKFDLNGIMPDRVKGIKSKLLPGVFFDPGPDMAEWYFDRYDGDDI